MGFVGRGESAAGAGSQTVGGDGDGFLQPSLEGGGQAFLGRFRRELKCAKAVPENHFGIPLRQEGKYFWESLEGSYAAVA
jgi:hypothetical protein